MSLSDSIVELVMEDKNTNKEKLAEMHRSLDEWYNSTEDVQIWGEPTSGTGVPEPHTTTTRKTTGVRGR